jgi:hypothetical protein
MNDTNHIIYEFGELEADKMTDSQLEQVAAVANNMQLEVETEMRKRRYQNKDPDLKTIGERVQQTDASIVQEFHKSPERIARMIAESREIFKDADEREMW